MRVGRAFAVAVVVMSVVLQGVNGELPRGGHSPSEGGGRWGVRSRAREGLSQEPQEKHLPELGSTNRRQKTMSHIPFRHIEHMLHFAHFWPPNEFSCM